MAVAVYLRVSTEEQRERQSIITQRDFAARYCDLHQLSIYAEYADDGVTGTAPLEKRPAGIRLLEDARRHKFDQLLVFKLDRLGREARHILNAVAELPKPNRQLRFRSPCMPRHCDAARRPMATRPLWAICGRCLRWPQAALEPL